MMRHITDENLLLLAHGELSAWRGLPLQIHLRRCPPCRARYAALSRTSAHIAASLRGPEAAVWQPAPLTLNFRFVLAWFAALLLLGLIGGAGYFALVSTQGRVAPIGNAKPADGCAPGLPSDRCR